MIHKLRCLLAAPLVVGAIVLMGLATWITPKPERLKKKDH
jgi:hypothetical protein